MPNVTGLHHVTVLASSAPASDAFWRVEMGLNRVARTVNADRPDTYHLIYGDAAGSEGSLLTVNPFPNLARGAPGVGEIAEPALSLSPGALGDWRPHLMNAGHAVDPPVRHFDRNRTVFEGPDGVRLALQIEPQEQRPPQPGPFGGRQGARGLHSVTLRVRDGREAGKLLRLLGFTERGMEEHVMRYRTGDERGAACIVDVAELPDAPPARMGAGSVHHAAFAVADADALAEVYEALRTGGYETTGIGDRTWFDSFHFRGPDGLLFEVATPTSGFTVGHADALTLPPALEGQRDAIETALEPLDD